MELIMENKNQPRALAYQLAQIVPDELLQEISGGGGNMPGFRLTFKISGPFNQIDLIVDF